MGRSYSEKVRGKIDANRPKKGAVSGSGKGFENGAKPRFPMAPAVLMGLILLAAALGAFMLLSEDEEAGGPIQNNGEGPASILLDSTGGRKISLADYRGRVVVLDMFATWCGPCRTQMRELELLSNRFFTGDLVILSVGADLSEPMDLLAGFKQEEGSTWTFARSNGDFNAEFPAESIPTIYILDREGRTASKYVGVTGADVLEKELAPLLSTENN